MPIFETIMILNPKENVKGTINKYKKLIQGFSNKKKIKVDELKEKKLSYEIQNHKTGYYVVFTYEAEPFDILDLEKEIKNDKNVLKFLTVKREDMSDALDNYIKDSKDYEQPDAVDVLLGRAEYIKK